MAERVPHTMRAVRLTAYGDDASLVVKEVAVPHPSTGQVLVRVEASPIHYDDVVFCQGRYAFRRAIPTTPGLEGVGTVVATGGGLLARVLEGRRVAFTVTEHQDGAWAEYAVVDAARCLPVWESIDDEQASMLLLDPLTALALFDRARSTGRSGIVQTGPTGTVGRILARLAHRNKVPVVHVAADAHEAEEVRGLGADVVLDGSADDLEAQLRRQALAWKATFVVDAVGGELTGRLLRGMPEGSEAVLYALRHDEPVLIDLHDLVYARKHVDGFCIVDWLADHTGPSLVAILPRLRRLAADGVLRLEVGTRLSLEEVPEVVAGWVPAHGGARRLVFPPRRADEGDGVDSEEK